MVAMALPFLSSSLDCVSTSEMEDCGKKLIRRTDMLFNGEGEAFNVR